MDTRAITHIATLCASVDPSVGGQVVHVAGVTDRAFELRLAYIANDDLAFINRCTQQADAWSAGFHREPYYSLAESEIGQTYIISLDNKPICVAEVYHALRYYVREEFMPKPTDYILKISFAPTLTADLYSETINFFTGFCKLFSEVKMLIIKPDRHCIAALQQSGFLPKENVEGYYCYSTSNENV